MAKKKLNEARTEQVNYERSLKVYKRNDMVQQARISLTVQEQRIILYAITKVKPSDSVFQEYQFDIKDFYDVCGLSDDSYNNLRDMMMALKKKPWWLKLDDGSESAVSWIEVCRPDKKSGKVTIAFHRDMMPFLLELAESGEFYTSYNLKYILPMRSQYAPRLYELLKSYQKNNVEWFFELDSLRYLLNCENYTRWPDFKRRALDPAVEEINKYTDLKVTYNAETQGRKVVRVIFWFKNKSPAKLREADVAINAELDGQIDIEEVMKDGRDPEGYARRRNKFFLED